MIGALNETVANHHRVIILSLIAVIVFMASACVFHEVLPLCHAIFGCDHQLHQALAQ